ncbi:MAG TPA: deoxyribonuclease IV [Clostridia bacterium]|nr:deoxyribonuclease IV [Clostridia bacterium]
MLLGAHCSTAGGAHMALKRAESIGALSCQIFVKSNMQWFGKVPSPKAVELFKDELGKKHVASVFGHAGYLINLGAQPSANRDNSLKSLIQEIEIATVLGLPFLVLHPGAHLGAGEAEGIRQAVAGFDEVFAVTAKSPVRIALENTAGQGSCFGNRISHLADIFDGVKKPERLGICLDTAHFFAAGYDIRTPQGWDRAIKEVGKLIGLRQILAFHLNDSKSALGTRVDRHEHIGLGKIGATGFRHIVNDSRFKKHPGCLETPKSDDLNEDKKNLATLRSLVQAG